MGTRRYLAFATILALILAAAQPSWAIAAPGPTNRQLVSGGTTTLRAAESGTDGLQSPEFPAGIEGDEGAEPPTGRSKSRGKGAKKRAALTAPVVAGSAVAGSTADRSFNGVNFRDQRLANGGNQFSVEPPDQALCVGGGFVLEAVNTVLRVYRTDGGAASGVVDLNTFYGYPAAIRRTASPPVFGPFLTDPICHFDPEVQRFFLVVLTLDTDPATGDFTGKNRLDLAVSASADPTGTWRRYKLAVQNDGTEGTPDDDCSPSEDPAPSTVTNPTACIGDYPHIGADKYGIFLTTNEYSFFGPEFKSAQIYAISKRALAAGAASPVVVQFGDTTVEKTGTPGFTVWPALSPGTDFALNDGGTEYFLSSLATEEAQGENFTGLDNRIGVWALTNTQSLDSGNPRLYLSSRAVEVGAYGVPPRSDQKAGPFPLGQCINDTTTPTPFGPGCWQYFFEEEPEHGEVLGQLDSGDSRMQQVFYANGKLWGALGTVVKVGGELRAGIAYYVIVPRVIGNGKTVGPQTAVFGQGYVAVAGNNAIYPALAVLPNGRGIMAFTLVGRDHHPSAAYTTIDAGGTGTVRVAAAGLGPQDGFSEYRAFASDPDTPRPRWGDYGAAAVDGNGIWIASEYIGQSCTLAQYTTPPIGSCGATRTSLGNWYTRISKVTP